MYDCCGQGMDNCFLHSWSALFSRRIILSIMWTCQHFLLVLSLLLLGCTTCATAIVQDLLWKLYIFCGSQFQGMINSTFRQKVLSLHYRRQVVWVCTEFPVMNQELQDAFCTLQFLDSRLAHRKNRKSAYLGLQMPCNSLVSHLLGDYMNSNANS